MATMTKRLRDGLYGTASIGTLVAGMAAFDETFRERLVGMFGKSWNAQFFNGLTFVNEHIRDAGTVIGNALGVPHAGMPLVFFAVAGGVLFVCMFRA